MTDPYRIWFIGDSSASGIGLGQEVFPRKVAALFEKAGRGPVRLTNCAVPGFTSTDAAALVHDLAGAGRLGPNAAVVLYVGNNECAVSRYKGRYTALTRWKRALTSLWGQGDGGFSAASLAGGIPFEMDPQPRCTANTLSDTMFNVRLVAREVQETGARCVVVVPAANHNFPHGMGLPNAPWFKTIGTDDCLSLFIRRSCDCEGDGVLNLLHGIIAFEDGRYREAEGAFSVGAEHESGGIRAVALGNLAATLERLGQPEEAMNILKSAAEEFPLYSSIYLGSMAALLRAQEQEEQAAEADLCAFEADSSIYRIKDSVRQALREAADKGGASAVIDVADEVSEGAFIDYCHPTPALHDRIAARIMSALSGFASEQGESSYETWFVSPDAYSGRCGTILDYYSIDRNDADPTGAFAQYVETEAIDAPGGAMLGEMLVSFTRRAMAHPLFAQGDDLTRVPPEFWFELLSFPEFHGYRVMASYLSLLEECGEGGILSGYTNFTFTSETYASLILMKRPRPVLRDVDTSRGYARRIIQNVIDAIADRKRFALMPETRRRTVVYWYTRESFRYGTHSRYSMLFDAWSYEMLMEALLVAVTIWRVREEQELFEAGRDVLSYLANHVEGVNVALSQGVAARTLNAAGRAFLERLEGRLQGLLLETSKEAV